MNHDAILQAAHQLHDAGLCVLPAAADGSKRPAVPWKRWQTERPSREQLTTWFGSGVHGVGVVCGAVSGNLEMLELEGRAMAEGIGVDLSALAQASGLAELLGRVLAGYVEVTPSGGVHLLYRVDGQVAGNTKLARRPATTAELAANPDDKVKVLIETRGEGGWVVTAPSNGATHETGKPWAILTGGPASIPTLTTSERDALHQLAAAFDRMPPATHAGPAAEPPAPRLFTQPAPAFDEGGISPGDDWAAKTSWEDILRGWTRLHTDSAGVTYWCRPGKTRGISATTGRDGLDNLWVFSSSTDFDPEKPYSKLGAHTLLTEGSTSAAALSAAATKLAAAGYGHRPEPTRPAPAVQPPPLRAENPQVAQVTEPSNLPPAAEQATYAQSDDGLALDLADTFGHVIRYCPDRGRWLAWDGHRWAWQPQGGGIVREYGKQVARALAEGDKPAIGHKKRALSALGTTATLAQAQTDPRLVVGVHQLDAHPMELNTPAGIVDLATGRLIPADASRLHTKVTACAPDPAADPKLWNDFLAETFGGDDEFIGYLQRLVGYSATGSAAKHVLPFCVGSGGNGKGVFLESLVGVLGEYATTAPSGFLMVKATVAHETEIARLAGMRMVVCSEVSDDDRFDEVKVKHLTGGDSLTARFMRQDHFTFAPTHHLWLMGNHQPAVRAGGRAFWRRLRLIPFDHEVPEEKMVDDLQGILTRDHGPALLAWIVAGAAAYATGGLDEPDRVKTATGAYEADQDTVARFVADQCHTASSDQVAIKISKLRDAYEHWCMAEGETPVSAKRLTMELARRHDVQAVKGAKGVRFYTRITIIEEAADLPPGSAAEPATPAPNLPPAFTQPEFAGGPQW